MAFWNKKETSEQAASEQVPQVDAASTVPQQPTPMPPLQQSQPPAPDPQMPVQVGEPEQPIHGPAAMVQQSELSEQAAPAVQMLTTPLAGSLGKVVSVMMFSRRFQKMTLSELRKFVLPAVTTNQYLVAEARAKDSQITTPLGVLLWARLSDELNQKLVAQNGTRSLLSGDEWNSGSHLWIIETIGSPKIVKAMVHQLIEGPFKEQAFKFCTRSEDGTMSVEEYDPSPAAN